MKRLPLLTAAVLILAAGTVHGLWLNRWVKSGEEAAAKEHIPQIPLQIGDWEGKEVEVDEKQEEAYQERGMIKSISRIYTDRKTGESVSLLVVFGRQGPITAHSPQACYGASNYREIGSPTRYELSDTKVQPTPEFWYSDFRKNAALSSPPLRIFYSFSPKPDTWVAPKQVRQAFIFSKFLYKTYLVETGLKDGAPKQSDPGPRFLREAMPLINQVLYPAAGTGAS
jgi:hypothetical protein